MTDGFRIGTRFVGRGAPCFVIAEVGINHGGSEEVAAEMVRAAAAAGADAVKLQTGDADESYAPGTASHAEFKGKELSPEAHVRLRGIAEGLGIVLFSTPADFPSLELCVEAGLPAIKVSSGLLTNTPLLRRCAAAGRPLVVSTGMAGIAEIDAAVETVRESGCEDFALLQCTSLYPAPADTLNLCAMDTLRARYGHPVGYSDHHDGALAAVAATALGAELIEKHFTLDRRIPGADHALSLEPGDFARMVREIRAVEAMRGDGTKQPTREELRLKEERHRCLHTRYDLEAGAVLTEDGIALMRPLPGDVGLPPSAFDEVIGKRLARAVPRARPITHDDLVP